MLNTTQVKINTGQNPLVSVIIPSYNSASFVVAAVETALAQTHSAVEVIVVDDGSTDDTAERLAPWQDRVRYIRQPNSGPAVARNRGIREAQGDLIAFLDADDLWLPDKLTRQLDCLRANPDAHLVHSDSYHLYEPTGERVYVDLKRERFCGPCYRMLFWENRLTTSTVMVTRQSLDRVGLFDEQIRGASTEDKDLWLRIARVYPFAYVNEPLILYRCHLTNGSHNQHRMLEAEYYVLAKALQADPSLWEALGRNRVQRAMCDLAFSAGYANVDAGDLARARRYFRAAIGHEPRSLKAWTFCASTFLRPGVRQRLRRMKQRLA